jgi:hypothetical protein
MKLMDSPAVGSPADAQPMLINPMHGPDFCHTLFMSPVSGTCQ